MIPFDRKAVLDILTRSRVRLTARDYIDAIRTALSLTRRDAAKVLNTLVAEQEIAFQDLYGSTYVDISFSKPVRVTDHFYLKPPTSASKAQKGELDINLLPGISFGSGHHPTTRLCLQAIDDLFFKPEFTPPDSAASGADIGTGSGVLAIALCLAGLSSCRAWDIDPNAVSEAEANIAANQLSGRIRIEESFMPPCPNEFSVICANLRFPTLARLSGLITENLSPDGTLILSGIREWEKQELISHYSSQGFSLVWERTQKQWSAVILYR